MAKIDMLLDNGIEFIVLGILLSFGILFVGQAGEQMVVTNSVTDEYHQPTGNVPLNVTVDQESDSQFARLSEHTVEVTFYDNSAGTNTTVTDSVDIYADDGVIHVRNETDTFPYNDSNDAYWITYDWEQYDEEARQGTNETIDALSTFTGWMPMIALAIVAVVVISYFLIFRRRRTSGRRGRA